MRRSAFNVTMIFWLNGELESERDKHFALGQEWGLYFPPHIRPVLYIYIYVHIYIYNLS